MIEHRILLEHFDELRHQHAREAVHWRWEVRKRTSKCEMKVVMRTVEEQNLNGGMSFQDFEEGRAARFFRLRVP